MARNFSLTELALIAICLDEEEEDDDEEEEEEEEEEDEVEEEVVEEVDPQQQRCNKKIILTEQNQLKCKKKRIRNEKEKQQPSKKKRIWVHPDLINRRNEGAFYTLLPQLMDDEKKFYEYLHMNIDTFEMILLEIKDNIQKEDTTFRKAITPREKLVVCLRFLATGDSYKTIAFSYRLGHSTVQSIILDVCSAINKKLQTKFIPTPSISDWERIAEEFWTKWSFPNCIGALEGKQVVIDSSVKNGTLFYRKTYSLILLALVDANRHFITVDIGLFGQNNDIGIFTDSNLGKALDKGILNLPNDTKLPGSDIVAPYVMAGGEAFPLKKNLMRPFPKRQTDIDAEKKNFNCRLSHARKLVDYAFGNLMQMFRFYTRRLKYEPSNATNIVLTTFILYNIIHSSNNTVDYFNECSNGYLKINRIQNLRRHGGNSRTEAFSVRDNLKCYFNSPVGSVKWQNEKEINEIKENDILP